MAEFQGETDFVEDPERAAEQLLTLLRGLPAFENTRGPIENWAPSKRERFFPVWDLWPAEWRSSHGQFVKVAWCAYGDGWLALHLQGKAIPLVTRAKGAATAEMEPLMRRLRAARADSIPEQVKKSLLDAWRSNPSCNPAGPEVLIRNVWHERREQVAKIKPHIIALLDAARRAVVQAGGDVHAVARLEEDALLEVDVVDLAIAQLRAATVTGKPASKATTARPQDSGGFDYTGSSESAVTATVRAVNRLRERSPDVVLKKEQVKKAVGMESGAGDRAIACAHSNKLITPDLMLTELGRRFLAERT